MPDGGSGIVTLKDERARSTPVRQEYFFRAISSRPGEPTTNLSPEQVLAIRHQVEADHLKRVGSLS
jgi:hypothetical protein